LSPSLTLVAVALATVALAAVVLALFVARHSRRRRRRPYPCPCRTHPLLHPLCRCSTATLITVAIANSSLALFVAALIIRRTLPLLVDCCFFTPPADGGGAVGGIICPSYSGDLSNFPLSLLQKMRRGAAELRPPRRLSLRLRAANFGQPLCQAHVHLEQRAGGVGGQACLRLV